MRNIKVKDSTSGSLTKVPDNYPVGNQRTGVVNYVIVGVPDDVTDVKAIKILSTCFLPKDRFEIKWEEVTEGKIFRGLANRGQPQRGKQPAANAGISLAGEVNDALKELAEREQWKKSYLVEQILRNYFELPADYTWEDLQLLKMGLLE